MTAFPFPTYDMSEADAEKQLDIYNALKSAYKTEIDTDFSLNIRDFNLFDPNDLNSFGATFRIIENSVSFYLNFIQIIYRTGGRRYSSGIYTEYQAWGLINLRKDFGHILIKPETFLDKVYDLINHVDLDFEDDKEFSKKYLVVANDKQKALMQMTQGFRDCISQIQLKEFLIEIVDDKLIIGDKKVISLEATLEFAKFLHKIAKVH